MTLAVLKYIYNKFKLVSQLPVLKWLEFHMNNHKTLKKKTFILMNLIILWLKSESIIAYFSNLPCLSTCWKWHLPVIWSLRYFHLIFTCTDKNIFSLTEIKSTNSQINRKFLPMLSECKCPTITLLVRWVCNDRFITHLCLFFYASGWTSAI